VSRENVLGLFWPLFFFVMPTQKRGLISHPGESLYRK
jgi:hypothetical protein